MNVPLKADVLMPHHASVAMMWIMMCQNSQLYWIKHQEMQPRRSLTQDNVGGRIQKMKQAHLDDDCCKKGSSVKHRIDKHKILVVHLEG